MHLVPRHRRRDRAGGGGAAGRPARDDERRAQRAERARAGDRHPNGGRRGARVHAHRDRPRGPRARPRGRHRPADLLDGGAATRPRCRGSDALDIDASEGQRRPYKHRGDAAWLETSPGEALADRIEVSTAWMNERSDKERWEAFAALGPPSGGRPSPRPVALMLKPRLAYSTVKNHDFEATVARLTPDFGRADPAARRPDCGSACPRSGRWRSPPRCSARSGPSGRRSSRAPGPSRGGRSRLRGDRAVGGRGGAAACRRGDAARVRGLRHAAARRRARRARRAQGAGRRNAGKKKAAKAADEPHGAEVTEARGTAETATAAA